ncbi:MAG: hypothetical protein JHC31_15335 [Sulfurihydrogenibium sp.]|jgi:hypothetical protein|nr:hypothetical protein [Sulfurihydrogenibium sp.]
MFFNITAVNGELTLPKEELETFALSVYRELQSVSQPRRSRVIDYLAELNGNSAIPNPDDATGNWRTNIKSSIFFQKTLFAYLYLRALLHKSTKSLLSFESKKYTYLPSAYRKVFNLGVYKTSLFEAIDKALWYGILSGELAILLDADYTIDEWDDVEFTIVAKALNPLQYYKSSDNQFYAYDIFLPIEKVKGLSKLWKYPPEKLEVYNLTTDKDRTDFLISSMKDRSTYGKITYVFGRYVNSEGEVSLPLKFTIYNDKYLVDVENILHADKQFPVISISFYSEDMQLSYSDLIWDYYKEDSRIMRAIVDRAILSTTMGFEINTSALASKDETFTVKPFTVIKTVSDQPAIRPFSMASFDPNVLPVRQLILQEAQNVSALTEFLMGQPTSKGRPTAKEVALKTQMNQSVISTIINRIEDEFIARITRKLISLMFQYHLNEIINSGMLEPSELKEVNELINMAILENREPYYYLVKELYKGTVIKVEGMSGVIKQKEELENILNVIEMSSNLGLVPYLNMVEIFKKIFQILQLDAELVRIPTPEELQAMAKVQLEKQKISEELTASISEQFLQDKEILSKLAQDPESLLAYIQMVANAKVSQAQQLKGDADGNSNSD